MKTYKLKEKLWNILSQPMTDELGERSVMQKSRKLIDLEVSEVMNLVSNFGNDCYEEGRLSGVLTTYKNYDSLAPSEMPDRIASFEKALKQVREANEKDWH